MRTLYSIAAALLVLSLGANAASAREIDPETASNTALSAAPMHSTSSSMRAQQQHYKRDANVPAKYDMSYPVRDYARTARERGAI